MIQLRWHEYSYFPYERDLARREVQALLGTDCDVTDRGVTSTRPIDPVAAERLTYFGHIGTTPTIQRRLEDAAKGSRGRQATRYSVHGLHEYKGKFNPQVAKAILNIFGVGRGSMVLDPFCGSGTTLVECAHLGAYGAGLDLNPLAIFLANAKLNCLSTPVSAQRADFVRLSGRLMRLRNPILPREVGERDEYLRRWFEPGQLRWIEAVRRAIEGACTAHPHMFMAIASNLLRDYSHQDPDDLRIRRRTTPLPELGFREAFMLASERFLERVEAAQAVLGLIEPSSRARLADSRSDAVAGKFDAAITSPPYATALPYIDTQRLSLVWLGLCAPTGIGPLDASLVGSREIKTRERDLLIGELRQNASCLPAEQVRFCENLHDALGQNDGFRRRAVPALLYRYLAQMRDGFQTVARMLKPGAPYALIIGHNHTVLSGVRRDIDTPAHLVALARSVGWTLQEAVPLQTYQRYGLHAANAVAAETLLILRNG